MTILPSGLSTNKRLSRATKLYIHKKFVFEELFLSLM